MKILLTGKPGIGKSTILQSFKQAYKGNIVGIIAHEIKDQQGSRVGFEAENFDGKKKLFAHKTLIHSPFKVGNKYFVDVPAIDDFIVPEIQKGMENRSKVIMLDEIGRMQAFSEKFLSMVGELLNTDTNFIGTIVYDDEPWALPFKNNPDIVLITVDETNRSFLTDMLLNIFSNIESYTCLTQKQKHSVNDLTKKYLSVNAAIQIKKLFRNAIPYFINGKVEEIEENVWRVNGNTRNHEVRIDEEAFLCDCDLFLGKGEFTGNKGECSHIQAVKLKLLKIEL